MWSENMKNKTIPSANYIRHSVKIMSWQPIVRNGWIIKFSVNKDGSSILLIFTSNHTGHTIIRHFTEEDEAVDFINYVTHLDPAEYI